MSVGQVVDCSFERTVAHRGGNHRARARVRVRVKVRVRLSLELGLGL